MSIVIQILGALSSTLRPIPFIHVHPDSLIVHLLPDLFTRIPPRPTLDLRSGQTNVGQYRLDLFRDHPPRTRIAGYQASLEGSMADLGRDARYRRGNGEEESMDGICFSPRWGVSGRVQRGGSRPIRPRARTFYTGVRVGLPRDDRQRRRWFAREIARPGRYRHQLYLSCPYRQSRKSVHHPPLGDPL